MLEDIPQKTNTLVRGMQNLYRVATLRERGPEEVTVLKMIDGICQLI